MPGATMTVAVIDTGGANLGSVVHALNRLGAESSLTRDRDQIRSAERVILPGVGAAARAMASLRDAGLVETVRDLSQPVLGICLGLQLLFEHSEEGDTACLGILAGRVRKLQIPDHLRLPHMGWSQMQWNGDDPLCRGLGGDHWFYFVHSYAAPAQGAVAVCEHGEPFAAVVRQGNFAACQFHPEKSARAGARLLRNFVDS